MYLIDLLKYFFSNNNLEFGNVYVFLIIPSSNSINDLLESMNFIDELVRKNLIILMLLSMAIRKVYFE